MNPVRKSLAVALLAAGSLAGGFAGSMLVRDGGANVARAQDAAPAPQQGNVSERPAVSEQDLAHVETLATVFRKVGKTIEPSVVNINVIKTVTASRPPAYDDMLRRFFPDGDGDGQPDLPEGFGPPSGPPGGGGEGREPMQQGTGSGVIMEVQGSDAYILTNNHVAGGATEILVTLADGRRIENGTVVGTDPKTDLAIIKVQADGLVAAPWGDSDRLEKGDWIMAFGSPFGYVGSMTHGIVSALNRRAGILGTNGYENFIQVDAPINPGNSGGPLVNVRGEVVGINTAIASRNGGFQGIGFAIPSNQAKFVYEALKANGKVVRGYLGVKIGDVAERPELARSFGYEQPDGLESSHLPPPWTVDRRLQHTACPVQSLGGRGRAARSGATHAVPGAASRPTGGHQGPRTTRGDRQRRRTSAACCPRAEWPPGGPASTPSEGSGVIPRTRPAIPRCPPWTGHAGPGGASRRAP